MRLTFLYRGLLSSCNYGCAYCPFTKRPSSAVELARDRADLARFVRWIESHTDLECAVFFTPWGEALIRRWYQEAVVRLSRLEHVRKVAIQTNLSCSLEWLNRCQRERLGLWCTYHPTQVALSRFLGRCRDLARIGIRYSVGVVGMLEHIDEIERLRARLDPSVYLWVNAYKRVPNYYHTDDVRRLEAVDPLFRMTLEPHASIGMPCRCGESVISVDGEGWVRRCHFVKEPIGNLYAPGFEKALIARPCPNLTCDCHIGYVQLNHLGLYELFDEGILERIPQEPIWPGIPGSKPVSPCQFSHGDSPP